MCLLIRYVKIKVNISNIGDKIITVMRTTLKDIANHLNLSISTVSRALSEGKDVSIETRDKVIKTASELNYRANPLGLNLKKGVTKTIGVIVPEMITPFAAEVISGIQALLIKYGYKIIIGNSEEDAQKEADNILLMENFMVDGFIICPCDYKANKKIYEKLQLINFPLVFYDRIPHGLDGTYVTVDDYHESFFMVEHLIRHKRKKIVYLQGPKSIYNSKIRSKAYKNALSKFNIPYDPSLVIESGMTFDDGRKAIQKLLQNNIVFDAIFAFTEVLALGAMNSLKLNNLHIPNDVAVATFSGTFLSEIVYPQLSSVEQPLRIMGQTAADLILEKIKNPTTSNKKITLHSDIQIRGSTGILR